jgi:phosphate acetyltransferase
LEALNSIIDAARADPHHIVLSEGEDSRVLEGSVRAVREGIARVTLLGDTARIRKSLIALDADPRNFTIDNPSNSARVEEFAAHYFDLSRHKGADEANSVRAVKDRLIFAAMMVSTGDADGTVSGATTTTADTVRTALHIIGPATKGHIVSSLFLMMLCEPHHPKKGAFVFSDCGLVVEPNADELANIAISSARSYENLTGKVPRVAMLSFSTAGSAIHDHVTKIVDATRLAREKDPSLLIDGAIQFDAAFIEAICRIKSPNSPLGGDANVFVFPNLDAANIGYKIAHRIGGAKAVGPILQGLARPANDLSRGCNADDVYHMIAVTCVQAAQTSPKLKPTSKSVNETGRHKPRDPSW